VFFKQTDVYPLNDVGAAARMLTSVATSFSPFKYGISPYSSVLLSVVFLVLATVNPMTGSSRRR
jgi:hypothetical protein